MEARELLRRKAIVILSGRVAEIRSLRGSSPGNWRRHRTQEERIAHHEAGHAIIAREFGFCVFRATIIPDRGQRVGNGCYSAGIVEYGVAPVYGRAEKMPILPDHQEAARLCGALAGGGWRATLRYVRQLQTEAEALIEILWPDVTAMAGELIRRRDLGQEEIAQIPQRRAGHFAA
jgi:hypothetical protein